MRVIAASARGVASVGDLGRRRVTCALVNNMPDGAFEATERQFVGLLEDGSGSDVIELRRYTMAGVPRGELVAARIALDYLPLSDLYLDPPDILLITGSNPVEARIQDELYWDDLIEMLSWSRENVRSTLLSCLSAHAALTHFDGIPRVRLPAKCTGVFPQSVSATQSLARGISADILLPHSRWNSVPQEALEGAGYDIVVTSENTGWGVATRSEDGRQLVLVQAHPEYDPSSLLREYRRDAGRFVRHERDDVPYLPYRCVASDDWELLEEIHRKVIDGDRDPRLVDDYPFDEVGARAPWPWRAAATRFYDNWLSAANLEEN